MNKCANSPKVSLKGDIVGSVKYLPSKPFGYNCYVYCIGVQGMGRTQKL